jgi:hypothetical protein
MLQKYIFQELDLPSHDRSVLRELAKRVAELAARPREEEKRKLWYLHNALEATRPLVFCDPENGWNEIITPENLQCSSDLGREWENRLRMEIFWGAEMQDDRVIEPYFDVPHCYYESDWGMHEYIIGGQDGGSYIWDAPLKDYGQMEALHFPVIEVDHEMTDKILAIAKDLFADVLTVRLKTLWWWSLGMTRTLVNLRGLTQIMYDMVDRPDDVHRLMAFLRDGTLNMLDFLQENDLLFLNTEGTYVGSGGFGWTHELPQQDFSGKVRLADLWGFAESQETVGISPAMFEEFIFPYQEPILKRFGLNCYGCCEPVDKRWGSIVKFPRLRRVSISPWSHIPTMAERLGSRYIFSMKPHPGDLAADVFDEDRIRANLRRAFQTTRDCRVEVIMKDNHTIRHDPTRVIRWVKIAHEEAERL